jgi:hypothetical protein
MESQTHFGMLRGSLVSLEHMSLWCLLFDPHITNIRI